MLYLLHHTGLFKVLHIVLPCSRNFGGGKLWRIEAKLHLAKKTLVDLSPALSFFRYCKQLVDKTLANS